MLVVIDGWDVSELVIDATASGSKSECARRLSIQLLQSAVDEKIPEVKVQAGSQLQFTADNYAFFGVVTSVTKATSGGKLGIKASDFGIYVKRNSVTQKIKNASPQTAAESLCKRFGIKIGYLEPCSTAFSRNFVNSSLYSAIMTGYTMDSKKTSIQYQMRFIDGLMCVVERGAIIGCVIEPEVNLISATYSESIENAVNRVDLYDRNGILKDSVEGDTSYGVMAQSITLSKEHDLDYARSIIEERKMERSANPLQILGCAECITGNAVLVYEPYTGLYGKFYIDSDTHRWKEGVYTTTLSLNYENSMDEQEAGSEIKKSGKKREQIQDEIEKPRLAHYDRNGNLIYEYLE